MKSITLLCFLTGSISIFAQNLVPNPDFENYSSLPDSWSQWGRCDSWTSAGGISVDGLYGDPDYFHVNGSGSVQLPSTAPAYINPQSGDAVMGFLGYHDPYMTTTDVREYLMTQLTSPLVIGEYYELSFWISNGESGIGHYYSCDGIGLNLSVDPLNQGGPSYINQTPEMEISGDQWSNVWEKKTFYFLADSAYSYLTIGNFYDDATINTTVQVTGPAPFAGAYYYVDNFDVHLSSTQAGTNEVKLSTLQVYPNPSNQKIIISGLDQLQGIEEFQITSVSGELVYRSKISLENIDVSTIKAGVYFLKVKHATGVATVRFIVN
jgi:hypothetical protein